MKNVSWICDKITNRTDKTVTKTQQNHIFLSSGNTDFWSKLIKCFFIELEKSGIAKIFKSVLLFFETSFIFSHFNEYFVHILHYLMTNLMSLNGFRSRGFISKLHLIECFIRNAIIFFPRHYFAHYDFYWTLNCTMCSSFQRSSFIFVVFWWRISTTEIPSTVHDLRHSECSFPFKH